MRLKRLQISIDLSAYSAMLAMEGVRRTTGVANIVMGDFRGYIIFLFILLRLILTVSCNKINFTGVLWEDDQYA